MILFTRTPSKAPRLHFNDYNSYTFETPDVTGTGTNYKGMVLYDLAVLYLTALPAIAHDSLIQKNISDGAIDGIMKIYTGTENRCSSPSTSRIPTVRAQERYWRTIRC